MRHLIPIFLTNTYTICVDWLQNFSQFFFLLCIHILWTMILLLLIKRWASWIWANIVFGFGEQKLVEMTVYQLLDKISRSLVQFHVLFWNPTTNIWSNPSCLQITSSFQNLKKRKLKKKKCWSNQMTDNERPYWREPSCSSWSHPRPAYSQLTCKHRREASRNQQFIYLVQNWPPIQKKPSVDPWTHEH